MGKKCIDKFAKICIRLASPKTIGDFDLKVTSQNFNNFLKRRVWIIEVKPGTMECYRYSILRKEYFRLPSEMIC